MRCAITNELDLNILWKHLFLASQCGKNFSVVNVVIEEN